VIRSSIVEMHGGTIDVASAIDQGTTFTIWIPRQAAAAETGARMATNSKGRS
jgi:signal transduction histidine kinase